MPLTSVPKDVATLTLTIVSDDPISHQRLWDAFTDPRQLAAVVNRTTGTRSTE